MESRTPLPGLLAGKLWTPAGFLADRRVRLAGGKIAAVEPLAAGGEGVESGFLDARDAFVIPGLVDLQVNGALGWSFQASDRPHFDAVVRFHRDAGTTTLLPTLVSAGPAELEHSLAVLSAYTTTTPPATLAGIHLEGPFLAPERSGAHDPAVLRPPDLDLMRRLLRAAGGRLRMVTLAPELSGAAALIELLVREGVLVAAGHTSAGYEQMREAVRAGLSFVTHAGNASDWPHRAAGAGGFLQSEPGVVGALLAEESLAGSVICDGHHLHPALLRPLAAVKGVDRLLLVSDASTAAGLPPGSYSGGGLALTVRPDGVAVSGRGGGWLAGSTIPLLEAVRRAVTLAGLPLAAAVHMAALGPARLLGLAGRKGDTQVGCDADLLVLAPDLTLRAVIVGGYPVLNTGAETD